LAWAIGWLRSYNAHGRHGASVNQWMRQENETTCLGDFARTGFSVSTNG
jgi:hypothetical protein